MSEARIPAEVFPPGQFIRDELEARGITERGFQVLLFALGCTPVQVCACEFAAYVDDKHLLMDEDTATCLSKAFGTSPEFFMNLDRAWRTTPHPNRTRSRRRGLMSDSTTQAGERA